MPPKTRNTGNSKKRKSSPTKGGDNQPSNKRQKSENNTSKESGAKSVNVEPVFEKWLFKSEPESRIEKGVDVKFGIEDLKNEPDQTAHWDGVRNYQVSLVCRVSCSHDLSIIVLNILATLYFMT